MCTWALHLCYPVYNVFGGCGLGGACSHVKVFGPTPHQHQSDISSEGIRGQYVHTCKCAREDVSSDEKVSLSTHKM